MKLGRGVRSENVGKRAALAALVLGLAACSSVPLPPDGTAPVTGTAPVARADIPKLPPAGSGRGAYYMDDGPGDAPPDGLHDIPDAEPRIEAYGTRGNKPYVVFGKTYTPITHDRAFKERGRGSWYGKKFHGQKTSSGELYDMYKMTAAHPTLPLPSYVRVTNLENGRQVIVRVNDRGPFHSNRVIDLSYTAALKLGYLAKGSAQLEVERLLPDEIRRLNAERAGQTAAAAAAAGSDADIGTIDQQGLPARMELAAAGPVAASGQPGPQTAVQNEAAPVVALPVSAPVVTSGASGTMAGVYLQFGAFGQSPNAEAARQRIMQEAGGRLRPLEVVEQGGLFRVYSGPYASRAEAEAAAQALRQGNAQMPLIVQR